MFFTSKRQVRIDARLAAATRCKLKQVDLHRLALKHDFSPALRNAAAAARAARVDSLRFGSQRTTLALASTSRPPATQEQIGQQHLTHAVLEFQAARLFS